MSQLHCYVTDEIAEKLKRRAEAARMPVSKYLALLIKRNVDSQWPEDYFSCFGGWQGDELQRPDQGDYEDRDEIVA